MKKILFFLQILVLVLIFLPFQVYAKEKIQITSPDGSVTTIDAGDIYIAPGSRLEVVRDAEVVLQESVNLENLLFGDVLGVSIGSNLKGLSKKEIPASVHTITSEQIKLTGARHLGELMQILVPGFMWVTDEDDYIYGFRGLVQDCNATVVMLINGQNIGYNYNYGLSTFSNMLDLNYIDHIEIITGPGSSEMGQGPLTGVINVVTKGADSNKSYVEMGYDYGTGDFRSYHGNWHHNSGELNFTVSLASFEQTDGFKPRPGGDGWVIPTAVIKESKYADQKPGYYAMIAGEYKGWNIHFLNNRSSYDPYTHDYARQTFENRAVKISKNFKINDVLTVSPEIHFRETGAWLRVSDSNEPRAITEEGETNYGGKLGFQFDYDKIKFSFGGDIDNYKYGTNPFTGRNYQYTGHWGSALSNQSGTQTVSAANAPQYLTPNNADLKKTNFGVYSEILFRLNDYNSFSLSSKYSYASVVDEWHVAPKVAYLGNNGEGIFWKVFYTKASRTSIDASNQSIPMGGFFRHYNDPDLKTQTIDDFEAHLSYEKERGKVELRSFYSLSKNIIQGFLFRSGEAKSQYYWWSYANAGNLNNGGFEFILNYKLTEKILAELSHSFVKVVDMKMASDRDLFVSNSLERFLNYPENVTRVSLTYKPLKALSLRMDCLYDYGRYQGDPASTDTSNSGATYNVTSGVARKSNPWSNINLGGVYSPKDNWEISLHIYNVLNNRPYWPVVFQNNNAVTATPRSFKAGVTYKF